MSKLTILFGAGAECDFGISNGSDFAQKVVGISADAMNDALCEHYKGEIGMLYGDLKKWYPDKFQEVSRKSNDDLRKSFLEACVRKRELERYDMLYSKNNFDKIVESEVKKLLDNKEKREEVEKDYTSYMGFIDEYFHTLIAPRVLGANKFCTVVAYYTRAYLQIVRELLNIEDTKENYLHILSEPEKMIGEIKNATQNNTVRSYYRILKEHKYNSNVITTNYTPLCENIAKIKSEHIAYVHGKIGRFESAYRRRVYDLYDGDELPTDDLLFPYLTIQSGVKPIIEETQLEEYSKALSYLREAERIIVLGYRINVDDNHLNALLSSVIRSKDKAFYYFEYEKEKANNENCGGEHILKKLRVDRCNSEFKYIAIDKDNCFEKFEKVISGEY